VAGLPFAGLPSHLNKPTYLSPTLQPQLDWSIWLVSLETLVLCDYTPCAAGRQGGTFSPPASPAIRVQLPEQMTVEDS
jgi:hypothetical protein